MSLFKKKQKKTKKKDVHNSVRDIENYEIADETTNKEVTKAIFGKEPSDAIYAKRIYSAPHMIVAGTTGSGKSVNVNSLLGSMMLTATPKQLRFIIIDPKAVEFSAYNDSPYMITNPITDMDKASKSLKWLVNLMQERYDMMRRMGEKGLEVPKNIEEYNDMVKDREEEEMYYTVAVVDEFSDLIGEHPEVEGYVVRIAQKARACGISLIIATQSPRSNVITGLIKANIPTRVCMMVVSSLESNIILDEGGGELLRPHGDMLIKFNGSSELVRCQGPYISNKSIKNLIEFSKEHYSYLNKPIDIFADMPEEEEVDPREARRMRRTSKKNNTSFMSGNSRKEEIDNSSAHLTTEELMGKPAGERTEAEVAESVKESVKEVEEKVKETEEKPAVILVNENKEEVTEEHVVEEQPKEKVKPQPSKPKKVSEREIQKANKKRVEEYQKRNQAFTRRNMMDKTRENAEFLMSDYAMRQHYQEHQKKKALKQEQLKQAMNKPTHQSEPHDEQEQQVKQQEKQFDESQFLQTKDKAGFN